jgi:anaerobic selenocysteine-containing dehydrogenase
MEQKILDKLGEIGDKSADRRDFLKKAGKAAVAVPAVALLLSANATPAAASGRYGHGHDKKKKKAKKFGITGGNSNGRKVGAKKVSFGFRKH